MSTAIKYAYLKQQTWLFRRNYPKHLQPVLGQALKQSLKTGNAREAKARVPEVNASYAKIVAQADAVYRARPEQQGHQGATIRVTAPRFQRADQLGRSSVTDLAKIYLRTRSQDLSPGGFKSVRFSVGMLTSTYGGRKISTLDRSDGQAFLTRTISSAAPLSFKRLRNSVIP